MNRKVVGLCCVVIVLLLAGCTSGGSGPSAATEEKVDSGDMHSVYFEEDSVMCHPYEWGEPGGMDCYPLEETSVGSNAVYVSAGEDDVRFGQGRIMRTEYASEGRVCYAYEWGEPGGVDCVKIEE